MRKVKVIVVLVISLAALFLISAKVNSTRTAHEYLLSHSDEIEALLFEDAVDSNTYVVFYVNSSNTASCAIMKKSILSYKILKLSSQVSLFQGEEPVNALFSSYGEKRDKWIFWGFIFDQNMSGLLVEGTEAVIAQIDSERRLFYHIGTGNDNTTFSDYQYVY